MPNQNPSDPNQNQPQGNPSSVPFSPQSDLPPLPPEFQTVTETKTEELQTPLAQVPPPTDGSASPPPPEVTSLVTPSKKKYGTGKIIATILGILILVGGVGAGIALTSQKQLFQQKATSFNCGEDDPNNSCVPSAECSGSNNRAGNCVKSGDVCCHSSSPSSTPKSGWGIGDECKNKPGTTGDHCILINCPYGCKDGCGENAPGASIKSGNCNELAKEAINLCAQVDLVNAAGVYCETDSVNAQINCPQPKCQVTATSTPKPTTSAPYCVAIYIYQNDDAWTLVDGDSLQGGVTYRFAVKGSPVDVIQKAMFKITHSGTTEAIETSTRKPDTNTNRFYIEYKVPTDITSLEIKAKVFDGTAWY